MDREHAVGVLRKVIAYCPAMKLNEDSRQAWAEALVHVQFADALEAVAIIGGRALEPGEQLWIQPGHVIAEVRRIRHKRIEQTEGRLTGAPDDPAAYLAWLRRSREELGDGRYEAPAIAVTGHTIAELPSPRRSA